MKQDTFLNTPKIMPLATPLGPLIPVAPFIVRAPEITDLVIMIEMAQEEPCLPVEMMENSIKIA